MLIYFDFTHDDFIDEFFTIFITLNILCGKFSQYNQILRQSSGATQTALVPYHYSHDVAQVVCKDH